MGKGKLEENGLLGVESSEEPKQSFLRSKMLIIFSATILGILVVGVTIGVSVAMATRDDSQGGPQIDRVPQGLSKIEDTDVYVVGDADEVITIFPDINGLSEDVKQIAQSFSKAGFTVLVIDYFNGNISVRPPANVSLYYSAQVISNLYKRGYKSIQGQGYCYGGRVGVSLSSMENTTKTCAVAHPSSLTQADAGLIIKPMFFELASNDTGFNPPTMVPYYNSTLTDRGVRAEFKVYPDTRHGFAVSGTNPEQKAICLQDSIDWFVANK